MKKSSKAISFFKNYKYENKENNIKAYYPNDIDDGVMLEYDAYSIELNPYEESDSKAKIVNVEGEEYCEYANIAEKISLQYKSINNGLKENIILESYNGTNIFKFNINIDGLVPLYTRGESIPLVKPGSDEVIAIIGQVDARDSYVGDYAEDEVHFTLYNELEIEHLSGNKYLLNVIVDEEFLKSENTVYPVVIDPSVTIDNSDIEDTAVYSGYPSKQTYYTSSYLIVGNHGSSYGTGRAFVQMTNISDYTSIDPDNVTCAYFHVYEGSGKTNSATIRVYDTYSMWTDTDITWNSKPGTYELKSCIDEVNPALYINHSGWYNFNITKFVKSWLKSARGESGGWSQKFGFSLMAEDESVSSKHFCSSEHGTKAPSIVIQYTTSGYGAAREYKDETLWEPNCLGYALGLEERYDIGIDITDTLETVTDRLKDFVRNELGRSIRKISDANSYIDEEEYRICMRIGIHEGHPTKKADYHFWVQLEDGRWAEKQGMSDSRTLGFINPSDAIWHVDKKLDNEEYYTSDTIYFAVTY